MTEEKIASKKEEEMAIGKAVQHGSVVCVSDERGVALITISGQLHGFTGSAVSVRRDGFIYTHDEKGQPLSTTPDEIKPAPAD
jgi:hypothetical protein